jgi:hypothetical protein
MTSPPLPVRRDPTRNAGFVACLIGALAMISGRFMAGAPTWLVHAGVAVIVLGWGLFGLSAWRRAALARAHGLDERN